MGLLAHHGIPLVYHYSPLHYLPFIAREGALLSKPALRLRGYTDDHFRSTSKRADKDRGFSDYVHLTTLQAPPILDAKLRAGFPHIEIAIPAAAVETQGFHLCRFNIAKGRYLRRSGKGGLPEGPANGRYYPGKQIPMAQTPAECEALLKVIYPKQMIEVLVVDHLTLPDNTAVIFFHPDDLDVGHSILRGHDTRWSCSLSLQVAYQPRQRYREQVRAFVDTALANPQWFGDGLEFDRV